MVRHLELHFESNFVVDGLVVDLLLHRHTGVDNVAKVHRQEIFLKEDANSIVLYPSYPQDLVDMVMDVYTYLHVGVDVLRLPKCGFVRPLEVGGWGHAENVRALRLVKLDVSGVVEGATEATSTVIC